MIFKTLIDTLKLAIIASAIVIPIRVFIFQPFVVNGESMVPNYYPADYLIIDEISYRMKEPQRGEVIVFKYPVDPSAKYIKRVIGLPGEKVEIIDSKIYITSNNQREMLDEEYLSGFLVEKWTNRNNMPEKELKQGEYFVLGDNRNYSSDSRIWGVVPEANIVGRVAFRISPLSILNKESIKNINPEY